MDDILTKLGMESVIQKFRDEKIVPDIVCRLSKFELQCVGLNNSSEIMKLRIECIKHGSSVRAFVGGDTFRRKYDIGKEVLENLIEAEFSVSDMSKLLSVSERTLYRQMNKYNLGKRNFSDIDDDALDMSLEKVLAEFPRCGEQMLRHLLSSKGIKITRSRVREALHRIDNDGIEERTRNRLHRRVYNVAAPNHLWHVDTNHKLIRWNFIIAGGIDGFSRFVVFLKCVNNNKADTIFSCFKSGVSEYGTPLRVRSDQGLENFKIAEFMAESRGLANSSMIVGKSTHNQRIERLWRDVFEGVLSFFYDLFYFMEDRGILNPLNDLDLYALHHVYTQKINNNLQMWRNAWNKHRIRTVKTSPSCLFTAGSINTPVPPVNDINLENPGEDIEQHQDQRPTLNPLHFELSERCRQQLQMQCPINWVSTDYGIDVYEKAMGILNNAD